MRLIVPLLLLLQGVASAQSPPFLLRESFDGVVPPALPPGWSSTRNRTPGVNDFTASSSAPRSMPNAVLSTNATIAQELHTPVLDFRSAAPESMQFFVRRSSSHAARVVVEASTDGGASFPLWIGDTLRGTASTGYVQHLWQLPAALAGAAAAVFRWRIIADPSGSTGTFRIDDVAITGSRLHDLNLRSVGIIPPHPRQDDSVTFALVVGNAGREPGSAFEVGLFLDRNADSLAGPAELIGTFPGAPGLAPGDSAAVLAQPGEVDPGRHLLIARLVAENDEDTTNNILAFRLDIGFRAGSAIINEIMYAPDDPEPEWVELLNGCPDTIDLLDWQVSDNTAGGRKVISPVSRRLSPGGMAVLTRDSAGLRTHYPGMPPVIVAVAGFPALNNTGDAVILFDGQGVVMDSVAYLPAWGGADGCSLERLDPSAGAGDPLNWESSTDSLGGTPGSPNSVVVLDQDLQILRFSDQSSDPGAIAAISVVVANRGRLASESFRLLLFSDTDHDSVAEAGELAAASAPLTPPPRRDSMTVTLLWDSVGSGSHALVAVLVYAPDMRASNDTARATLQVAYAPGSLVINEIMAQPPAGGAEYIEVLCMHPAGVNLTGWRLGGFMETTTIELGTGGRPLSPDGFLVVASDSSVFESFPRLRGEIDRVIVLIGGSLGLNNDRDNVVVTDPTGRGIDSVFYSSAWHNPGVDDPAGRSLERIMARGASNDARNWSTCATAEGGTPGGVNSIRASAVPADVSLSASPNPFSPDGDGWEDFTVIQFRLSLQVSVIRLRLFDVRGRLIRTLANSEPAGARGEIIWDGLDDARQKARIGIYVLLLEAIDDRGGVVETVKGTVVLAGRL